MNCGPDGDGDASGFASGTRGDRVKPGGPSGTSQGLSPLFRRHVAGSAGAGWERPGLAHNPEVEGSNPSPATNCLRAFARSSGRPFGYPRLRSRISASRPASVRKTSWSMTKTRRRMVRERAVVRPTSQSAPGRWPWARSRSSRADRSPDVSPARAGSGRRRRRRMRRFLEAARVRPRPGSSAQTQPRGFPASEPFGG
jgi:hypothetical protein